MMVADDVICRFTVEGCDEGVIVAKNKIQTVINRTILSLILKKKTLSVQD